MTKKPEPQSQRSLDTKLKVLEYLEKRMKELEEKLKEREQEKEKSRYV